jgi:hypothetical protein
MKARANSLRIAFAGLALAACNAGSGPAGTSNVETSSTGGSASGNGVSQETTGSLGIELVLGSGQNIPVLAWSITGPGGAGALVKSGSAQSVATGASFEVGGIPAASGYTVTLSGTSTDGSTTCSGAAAFSIQARQTTNVRVELGCSVATTGSHVVLANGDSFNCAAAGSISANPREVQVGSSVMLSATAKAPVQSAITYAWSAPTGTFSSTGTASTSFTCTNAGPVSVSLAVADGPVPPGSACSPALSTQSVVITCDSNTTPPPPSVPATPPWALGSLAALVMSLGSLVARRGAKRKS